MRITRKTRPAADVPEHVDEDIAEAGFKARLILQVHDELLFEAPDSEAEAVAELVQKVMQGAEEISVPLVVETGVGEELGCGALTSPSAHHISRQSGCHLCLASLQGPPVSIAKR